jgi:myosin heavy subunit
VTVADIVVFLLGFFSACLLGLIACRLVWVRAVRLTRARLERDRPETLRAFEARIAGAQARAAISIRELERALDRERQMSAQARLMADQMTSSSALALAERDDTQSSLVNLSDTLNTTRERLREHEETLMRRNSELADLRRDLSDVRQELAMRDDDIGRLTQEAESLRAELAAHLAGDADPSTVSQLAETGDAAAMARTQIENLRETVRTLRSEKNAAEASAARARLLLDARDDNQALAAAKADFDAERDSLMAKISELESELRNAPRPGPQLVSVDGEERPVPPLVSPTANTDGPPTDLDSLRASIDEMTASLTANAAIELDGQDRINALLDEAEQDGADSNLVTSLVEARDRLRSKKKAPARGSSKASTKAPAKTTGDRKSAKSTGGKSKGSSGSKIVAATASGAPVEKSSSMPRASENDLKVI